MFCMHCGKKIDDSATFCGYCGGKIGAMPRADAETDAHAQGSVCAEPTAIEAKRSKAKTITAIVCVVVVLAGTAAGLFILKPWENSEPAAETVSAPAIYATPALTPTPEATQPPTPTPTPTLDQKLINAYKAYYDVLKEKTDAYGVGCTGLYANFTGYDSLIAFEGVVYAELIDFDNDGIKELLVVWNDGTVVYGEKLTIYSYIDNSAVAVFQEDLGKVVVTVGSFEIATGSNGLNYVIHNIVDYTHDIRNEVTSKYYSLVENSWTQVLSRFTKNVWGEEGWEFFWFVNEATVSEDIYDAAPETEFGIINTKEISYLVWSDTDNKVIAPFADTVYAVLAELEPKGIAQPTGAQPSSEPVPVSPEILAQLEGNWVDVAFYDSDIIDRSVLYPVQLEFVSGDTMWNEKIPYGGEASITIHEVIKPISWGGTGSPHKEVLPLTMTPLADGSVKMKYDTSVQPYRISSWEEGSGYFEWGEYYFSESIDEHSFILNYNSYGDIENITYHCGNEVYTLMRYGDKDPSRYYVKVHSDSVELNYFAGNHAFWKPALFAMYRSEVEGERGIELYSTDDYDNFAKDNDDTILCRFTDDSAQKGKTYYYSLWYQSEVDTVFTPAEFGGQWQMKVTT